MNCFSALSLAGLTLAATTSFAAYNWQSVQFHGGGYVPGITCHPTTGDCYARTDVGGAYRLSAGEDTWVPLNDMFTGEAQMGSMAIAIDPEDANYLYSTGGLYPTCWDAGSSGRFLRSDDKGTTWTEVMLNTTTVSGTAASDYLCLAGNNEGRGMGNRIAVDGSTLYFGTNQNGLLKSTDRGNTWTTLTVASFANTEGYGSVFVDNAGAVYAAPYSGGLYKSENGGTSWSQVSSITGTVYESSYNSEANVAWLTTNTASVTDQGAAEGGKLFRLDCASGTVGDFTSKLTPTGYLGLIGVVVNPADPSAVAVSTTSWSGNGGFSSPGFVSHASIFYSADGGENWKEILRNGSFAVESFGYASVQNPHWVSALAIDPNDNDHILFGTGFGVVETKNASASQAEWSFASKGIEETVPLGIVSTTYGAPLVSVLGDVSGAYHIDLDATPTTVHPVDGTEFHSTSWDIDYAGQDPKKMVRVFKKSGTIAASSTYGAYSEDGGKTWTKFATNPSLVMDDYGNPKETNFIAVSADGSTIVWNGSNISYSTDNGQTWKTSTGTSGLTGYRVVADKVGNAFYIYNPVDGKIYKSETGASWATTSATLATFADYAYGFAKIYASPDAEGEIWALQGGTTNGLWTAGTDNGGVVRSTDGGNTFSKVDGIQIATVLAFGKGKTEGKSAVYFYGYTDASQSSPGVYRSDDYSTWTRIDDGKHNYGGFSYMVGDPCIYSRIYIGSKGRGMVYAEEPGNENTCATREDNGYITPAYYASVTTLQNAPVRVFDLQGNLVGTDLSTAPNVRPGVYIVQQGSAVKRVVVK
jgi:hypothetical protein